MINFLVKEPFYGEMEDAMMVNGIRIKCMVEEGFIGLMDENMTEK